MKKMHDYLETIETAKKVKLEPIDKLKKGETAVISSDRGTANPAPKLVKKLVVDQDGKKLSMNDIAIYTGVVLNRLKQKPEWNINDIQTTLMDERFMRKHYYKLFDSTENMSEDEMKDAAREIAHYVVNNEADTIQNINRYLSAKRKGNRSMFIHQMNSSELDEFARNLEMNLKLLEQNKLIKFEELINYEQKGTTPFTTIVNNVLRALPQENMLLKTKIKSDVVIEKIDDLSAYFTKFLSRHLIIPEPTEDIKDLNGFISYIKGLDNDRTRANKIIKDYQSKQKTFEALIKGDLKAAGAPSGPLKNYLAGLPAVIGVKNLFRSSLDLKEKSEAINNLAKELIKKTFIKDHEDLQPTEDPEGELAGMLGQMMKDSNIWKGHRG